MNREQARSTPRDQGRDRDRNWHPRLGQSDWLGVGPGRWRRPRHRHACERPQQGRRQQGKHRRGRCPRGSRARRLLRAESRPERAGPGETASAHNADRSGFPQPAGEMRGSRAQLRNPGRHAHTGADATADDRLMPSARCALLQKEHAKQSFRAMERLGLAERDEWPNLSHYLFGIAREESSSESGKLKEIGKAPRREA